MQTVCHMQICKPTTVQNTFGYIPKTIGELCQTTIAPNCCLLIQWTYLATSTKVKKNSYIRALIHIHIKIQCVLRWSVRHRSTNFHEDRASSFSVVLTDKQTNGNGTGTITTLEDIITHAQRRSSQSETKNLLKIVLKNDAASLSDVIL